MFVQNNNLSVVQNFKANKVADNLAKGRWGNKFKKLYNFLKDENNKADFTSGMINCAGTDVLGIVEELEKLRDGLNDFFKLSDGGTAKPNSYFNLLCFSSYDFGTGIATPKIDNVELSLSLDRANILDDRRISKFFKKNSIVSTATSYLEPIDSYFRREAIIDGYQKPFYSKNQLSLVVADGTRYGHIEDTYVLAPNTNFSNSFVMYGVEESNSLFLNNFAYENEFLKLFSDLNLEKWLIDFATYSYSFEKNKPTNNNKISIIFGADLLLEWINENLAAWYAYLNGIDNTRTGIELEMVTHLNLCNTLQEEIGGNAGEIANIWLEFRKEVTPPLPDSAYEWWEEEQFAEIRKKFKNFHLYCTFILGGEDDYGGDTTPSYVILKDSAFELSGYKIYWLVMALLTVDSRARKRSFLERLFSIVLLVVAIYLTAITQNPIWLKIVLIIITLASYSGALSPKAQLIVSAVMLAYGVYNTEFSAMTAMELFNWSIENIDLVLNVITKPKSLEDESVGEIEEDGYEKQDKAMRYVYSDVYDCHKVYDDSISVSVEI